jgi:hypothetical protein
LLIFETTPFFCKHPVYHFTFATAFEHVEAKVGVFYNFISRWPWVSCFRFRWLFKEKRPPSRLPSLTAGKLTLRRMYWEEWINLHLRERYWHEARKISIGYHYYFVSGILCFIACYGIKTNIQDIESYVYRINNKHYIDKEQWGVMPIKAILDVRKSGCVLRFQFFYRFSYVA